MTCEPETIYDGKAIVRARARDGTVTTIEAPLGLRDMNLVDLKDCVWAYGADRWQFIGRSCDNDSLLFQRVMPVAVPVFKWVGYELLQPKPNVFRVCCDFDSVLHADPGNFTDCDVIEGDPNPGAIDWLVSLLQDPEVIVTIHTCRFTQHDPTCFEFRSQLPEQVERGLKAWLVKHGVPEPLLERLYFWRGVGKPIGDVYIDDKAFTFTGVFPAVHELKTCKAVAKNLRAQAGCK